MARIGLLFRTAPKVVGDAAAEIAHVAVHARPFLRLQRLGQSAQ